MELRFPYRRIIKRGRTVYQPRIPLLLIYREKEIPIWPLVDSGAGTTIFRWKLGSELGVDVASGERKQIRGIGGSGVAFYHPVELSLTDGASSVRYTTRVGFTRMLGSLGLSGLLGQIGFFDRFRVTFDYPRLVIVRTRAATSAGR